MGLVRTPSVVAIVLSPAMSPKEPAAVDPHAPIAGRSLVDWVTAAATRASIRHVLVVDWSSDRDHTFDRDDGVVVRRIPVGAVGIGDAVSRGMEAIAPSLTIDDDALAVVLVADAPQVDGPLLRAMLRTHRSDSAAASLFVDPHRDDADGAAVEGMRTVHEPETLDGVLILRAAVLGPTLRRATSRHRVVEPSSADVVAELRDLGHPVTVRALEQPLTRITNHRDRVDVESQLRQRIVERWLDRGVAIPDPRQVTIDADVEIGPGTIVHPGTVIVGQSVIGEGAILGPNAEIRDATIGTGAHIAHAVVDGADVDPHEVVQPFTVVRR